MSIYGDCPISDKQVKEVEDAALVAMANDPYARDAKVLINAHLVLKLIEEVSKPNRYDTHIRAENLYQDIEIQLLRDVLSAARLRWNKKAKTNKRKLSAAIYAYDHIGNGHNFK